MAFSKFKFKIVSKEYSFPRQQIGSIPKCKRSQSNLFLTAPTKMVLLIHKLSGQWSQIDLKNNGKGGSNQCLQWYQNFFPMLIWFFWAAMFFLLPPTLIGSEVAWDTWYVGVRKAVILDHKINLSVQGIKSYFDGIPRKLRPDGITFWWPTDNCNK